MSARAVVDMMRQMIAAGATHDAMLIAAEAIASIEDAETRRRAAAADRKRRQRAKERDCPVTVTGQSRDIPPPPETKVSPVPPSKTQPPVRTLKGPHCPPDGDEKARATLADADRVVAQILEASVPEDHALRGDVLAASACLGWLRSGFDPDLDVIPAVRKAMAGRYRIAHWSGLSTWVANAHRDRLAAEEAQPMAEVIRMPNRAYPAPRSHPAHEILNLAAEGWQ
ncbi:MAG: hypothetical protein JNK84_17940 [Phreatobacter sp.]|uniref:hypothetical protein n=1 Tax=Phreatobacter sp. TaxID=1966341 RepID=UPI001A5EBBAB|nr:hypothetical protein [Phreatobacter sp.]MBL8570955.1 hypothetical protein [Phreatobacter sp.]